MAKCPGCGKETKAKTRCTCGFNFKTGKMPKKRVKKEDKEELEVFEFSEEEQEIPKELMDALGEYIIN